MFYKWTYYARSIFNTIIEIAVGVIVYIMVLFMLKYQFLYDICKQIITGIKEKINICKEKN